MVLVTDGRLSGASGKIPAAIHITPEAAKGGPLAQLQTGDRIRLDATNGTLHVLDDIRPRPLAKANLTAQHYGLAVNCLVPSVMWLPAWNKVLQFLFSDNDF